MLETTLLTLCLAAAPDACATRMLPAVPCGDAGGVAAWLAEHPELTLRGTGCGTGPALDVTEIAPGVFVHRGRHEEPGPGNGGDQANIGFVIGTRAVAVIDTGGSRALGEALLAAIRERTDLPITHVILTHMHPDHVMGTGPFAEIGAEILGHAHLSRALEARAGTYMRNWSEALGPGFIGTRIVLPDRGLAEPAEIGLGGRTLRLVPRPTAHTDNDLTVFDGATGTLWLSDLLFAEHAPVIDGSLTGWLGVLDMLEAEPAARAVPGHGPPSLPWPGGAAPLRAYLEGLAAETRAAIAAGESMSEAVPHLGHGLGAGWELFDLYNPRNATAAYQELEWE